MDAQPNGELIPQGGGDNIPLERSPLIIGRRESCDVCLEFSNVSGKHCELTFKEGLWILRDMDSKNGTKINGTRLDSGAKKVVHTGDVIGVGKRMFKIEYTETGRASDTDEFDEELENAVRQSLLEKAGLAHPPRHKRKPALDPNARTPLPDDDDDDD
jgi:pSer/pThr/pTyr-binding forkhead associated (FHA) protein